MARLTDEQRNTIAAQIGARAQVLRAAVASALRQPDDSETMHLANHLNEIDDQAVADLETSLDVPQSQITDPFARRIRAGLAGMSGEESAVVSETASNRLFAFFCLFNRDCFLCSGYVPNFDRVQ